MSITAPEQEVVVSRYTGVQRVNHWITAALFTLLGLSGLAMFSPYLFFLTGLFGGGQSTRAVHPWFGVALMLSFAVLFVRFWRLNMPNRDDILWMLRIGDIVQNRHDRLPAIGKYNAGQKGVFWSQTALILVMFVSGVVIWDQYFFTYTADRGEAVCAAVAFFGRHRRDHDHPGAHLCRPMDTRHQQGDDPRQRDRRLGAAPSSQMVQAGHAARGRASRHRPRLNRRWHGTAAFCRAGGPGRISARYSPTRPRSAASRRRRSYGCPILRPCFLPGPRGSRRWRTDIP